jgi:hypothetical protein
MPVRRGSPGQEASFSGGSMFFGCFLPLLVAIFACFSLPGRLDEDAAIAPTPLPIWQGSLTNVMQAPWLAGQSAC